MKQVEQHHTYLNERFAYYPNIDLFANCSERLEFDTIVDLLRIDFEDGTRVRLNAYVCFDEEDAPYFDFPEVYLLPRQAKLTERRRTVVKTILRRHNYPRWLREFVDKNL